MMMLSGITLPLEMMPETVRKVAGFIPLTHVTTLLRGLWFGNPVSQHMTEIVALAVILVVGMVVAARTFRWE